MSSLLCQPNKVQEKPEERVTPVAPAADMEIQLPTTDKRAVGTVEDSGMEDSHKESKRTRTTGGMEVCVLDDKCDEWLDELGQMLEDQEGSVVTMSLQAHPRTLLALLAIRNSNEARYTGLFDISAAFVHSPVDELIVLTPPVGIVQPGQGLLLRQALYGTRKATKLWAKTYSKALSSDGWAQSTAFPGTLYHASQVATSTCHGDDFFVEASLQGRDNAVQPFRDREACCRSWQRQRGALSQTLSRWVEHKRCFTWSAQAEKAIHMCDLAVWERTSLAVKVFRQGDGDEPVNDEKKSWLRSLVGVLGNLATDRLDVQYLVKNFMREITRATCGTLARGQSVVRYFVHKLHLAWSFPAGDKLEYLDVYADSDWAASKSSSCVVIRQGQFNDARRYLTLQWRSSVVRSNSSGTVWYPTAAIPHRNRLPTSVACT